MATCKSGDDGQRLGFGKGHMWVPGLHGSMAGLRAGLLSMQLLAAEQATSPLNALLQPHRNREARHPNNGCRAGAPQGCGHLQVQAARSCRGYAAL